MALSDDRIAEMMRDTWGCASIAPRHALEFARAIEAEVRKDDEALIRQMMEALETCDESDGYTGLRQFFDDKAVEASITEHHQMFMVNSGDHYCHAVKPQDADSPATCLTCRWEGERRDLNGANHE